MIERRKNAIFESSEPRVPERVNVVVSEVTGVIFLGVLALLLTIVLGVVVIRLSGRRGS
jgi:hypothetical protein